SLIVLVISVCYVVNWEIMYFKFMPNFVSDYSNYMVEKLRAAGATQQAIDAKLQEMKELKQLLDNPFKNAAMSFIEPLPVGLIITLISSLILKKEGQGPLALKRTGQTDGGVTDAMALPRRCAASSLKL